MAANKPILPKFDPNSSEGQYSRALDRELRVLERKVTGLVQGRISGVLAMDAAPTGGTWAPGDVVRNSAPTKTVSASSTFVVWGWTYTDEGAGTYSWSELRFWDAMAAAGSSTFNAASQTATNVGAGVALYDGNDGTTLRFRTLKEGTGISLTISGSLVRIVSTAAASSFDAASQTATNVGAGVALYDGNDGTTLRIRTLKEGTGVSITVSGSLVRIASTVTGLTMASITATHTGTGVTVYNGNTGTKLEFRKVQAGTGISVTTSAGAIRIASTGGAAAGPTLTVTPTNAGWTAVHTALSTGVTWSYTAGLVLFDSGTITSGQATMWRSVSISSSKGVQYITKFSSNMMRNATSGFVGMVMGTSAGTGDALFLRVTNNLTNGAPHLECGTLQSISAGGATVNVYGQFPNWYWSGDLWGKLVWDTDWGRQYACVSRDGRFWQTLTNWAAYGSITQIQNVGLWQSNQSNINLLPQSMVLHSEELSNVVSLTWGATVFNVYDKGSALSLSTDLLTLGPGSGWLGCRARRKQSTGIRYFEVTYPAEAGNGYLMTGVAAADAIGVVTNYGGSTGDSWAYQNLGTTSLKWHGGSSGAYGSVTWTTGDVIGILMNFNTYELTFYRNGVSYGVAYNASLTVTLRPAVWCFTGQYATARFSSLSWSYPPGVGETEW